MSRYILNYFRSAFNPNKTGVLILQHYMRSFQLNSYNYLPLKKYFNLWKSIDRWAFKIRKSTAMKKTKTKVIMTTPNDPIELADGRLSMTLIFVLSVDDSCSLLTTSSFFISSIALDSSSLVKFFCTCIRLHGHIQSAVKRKIDRYTKSYNNYIT